MLRNCALDGRGIRLLGNIEDGMLLKEHRKLEKTDDMRRKTKEGSMSCSRKKVRF